MKYRTCRECGITEDMVPFYSRMKLRKNGKRTISHENICMICKRENTATSCRKHWEAHKERRKQQAKKWRSENRSKYNKSQRIWWLKNKKGIYNPYDYGFI